MAARIQSLSEQQIDLFQKEGRGTGDGADYVAGRDLRDMSGIGRLRRFACTRCGGRQIVLPSDAELSMFLDEHWDPCTRDLHEHFPLIDVEKTMLLAEILGVRHPKLRDGSPAILMTSLMVSKRKAGSYKWQAIDIVSSREAQHTPSDANRIKSEYWRRLGVDHRIEYSTGLDSHKSKHLWNLFNIAESIANRGLSDSQRLAQQAVLKRLSRRQVIGQLKIHAGSTLLTLCHEAADTNGIARAACVAAMHELIALGIVECSLDIPVLLSQK
ncbi:hypothetical protein P0D88_32160 [Paraburkholderia sp. RL18-103-BIB-C]|uniref:hypothetical protein n=1 Tax=Paraburkholderia sp. RL18-103-BIB-C TaxID=3031637 RepID=UPI0038B97851